MVNNPILEKFASAWDLISRDYDEIMEKKIVWTNMREVSLKYLGRYFLPGMKILELGCGTGDEAIYLARRGINVSGTDISQSMVNNANEKAMRQNLGGSCSFRQLPIERINEINEVFDGAYSSFGPLNCIDDMKSFSEEINNKIRKGGYFIVSVMNRV